jgi:protein-serine/threonine kinase
VTQQVDKRGLPVPSSFGSTGGVLKGFLLRRGSSQHGAANNTAPQETDGIIRPALVPSNSSLGNSLVNSQDGLSVTPSTQGETIFGDVAADAGDEVKFSVELTRIDRLDDTYSLDIRRLKGNLRSYKFLYDSLREYVDL